MKKLTFKIDINAPKEKVWRALWNDLSYRKWTSVFSVNSHVQTDWKEGSKVLFLDGTECGMFSVIAKSIPNSQMVFRHLGEIKDGKELENSWTGACESYFLDDHDGNTGLRVEMDTVEEHEPYFRETFPKALGLLKQIAEQ